MATASQPSLESLAKKQKRRLSVIKMEGQGFTHEQMIEALKQEEQGQALDPTLALGKTQEEEDEILKLQNGIKKLKNIYKKVF